MLKATAILLSLVFTFLAQLECSSAKEVQVIEIRKNLQLSNDEAVYTDYYLNAGDDLGIKPGTTFVLYRRVNVIDRLGTNQGRALSLPVGKIKIIYVAKDLSVARVEKLEQNANTPILEHRGVMLGDLINVESAAMTNDKNASYGPQGLGISFAAQPVAPMIEESIQIDSRMPASESEKVPKRLPAKLKDPRAADTKAIENLLKKSSRRNGVETIESNNNSSEKMEVPVIR